MVVLRTTTIYSTPPSAERSFSGSNYLLDEEKVENVPVCTVSCAPEINSQAGPGPPSVAPKLAEAGGFAWQNGQHHSACQCPSACFQQASRTRRRIDSMAAGSRRKGKSAKQICLPLSTGDGDTLAQVAVAFLVASDTAHDLIVASLFDLAGPVRVGDQATPYGHKVGAILV